MSAPNFYSLAGTVYAIELTEDDYDFEIESVKQNIVNDLAKSKVVAVSPDDDWDDASRGYPGRIFANVTMRRSREDLWVEAKLIVRSGYYADANIDFAIAVYQPYSGEYHDLDDLEPSTIQTGVEAERERSCSYREAERVKRRLRRDAETIRQTLDQCLTKYTSPLIRVATFSNGEAVYEQKRAA